jgi:hypothetical protein
MNIGYLIYQAERPLSRTEQHAADTRHGELAKGISRLLHRKRAAAAASTAATARPVAAAGQPAAAAALSPLAPVPDCACSLTHAPDCAPAR